MPYIEKPRRQALEPYITELAKALHALEWRKGDLNYVFSRLIFYRLSALSINYDNLSDITGILNDVKTEFERRIVALYEDAKLRENGEVYGTIERKPTTPPPAGETDDEDDTLVTRLPKEKGDGSTSKKDS